MQPSPALHFTLLRKEDHAHRCSYQRAMASRRQRDLRGVAFPVETDMVLTAVHETGHAVISYAAGLGCGEIALTAHLTAKGRYRGTNGEFGTGLRAGNMIGGALERGEYNPLLFANAMLALAGMVAERKASIVLGLKPNVASGGIGDRAELSAVAKVYVRQDRRRSRTAFAARVWTAVQDAMDDPRIWKAILDIAKRLTGELNSAASRKRRTIRRYALSGGAAAAIMRRNGVRAGMLA